MVVMMVVLVLVVALVVAAAIGRVSPAYRVAVATYCTPDCERSHQ